MSKNFKTILKTIVLSSIFAFFFQLITIKPVFGDTPGLGCTDPGLVGFCAFTARPNPWACGIIFSGTSCDSCTGAHNCICAPEKDSCNIGNFICNTEGCPDESGYEGSMCLLADPETGPLIGDFCWSEKEGRWDPDERMCVTCDGKPYQVTKVADMIERCYACTAKDTWTGLGCENTIPQTCEVACGADSQCDEANYGKGVIAPSGATCDDCKCVANCGEAKPQCSDGIDNDGDGFCDLPTSVCTDGSTPGDPQCTDANDNDESDGAGTCACPKCPPELEGGLVPCGRMCDDTNTDICECDPCTLCHLFVLFKRIVDFLAKDVLFPLAVLMIIIGGVMFLTAAGDPGRIGNAKKILTAVVIGLVIIFLAWLIVDTIIGVLVRTDNPFGMVLRNWSDIPCPICGDGVCESKYGENSENCPADCAAPPPPPGCPPCIICP